MMDYNRMISDMAVLGAAGKMGSGIVWLALKEMAGTWMENGKKAPIPRLAALDMSEKALEGLTRYVRAQALRLAEKEPEQLSRWFPDVAESARADAWLSLCDQILDPTTRMEDCWSSQVVFEAVSENRELKIKLFREIRQNSKTDPWFLTNTSSIPIGEMDREAGLDGRLAGFHFYNPPAVQKLVELIIPGTARDELADFAQTLAERLRKTVVYSRDIAGFIGNGHFMRDLLYGVRQAEERVRDLGFPGAVSVMNRVSSEWLIRPMGIFQLADYVGLDVCQSILRVMDPYFEGETLHSQLIDEMVSRGARGGQFADGSQKNGFLEYNQGKITGVFDPESGNYISLEDLSAITETNLGPALPAVKPWKEVIRMKERDDFLSGYFTELKQSGKTGASLAMDYLAASADIARKLVEQGVASDTRDVNTVLMTGFFHAYGPVNDYL